MKIEGNVSRIEGVGLHKGLTEHWIGKDSEVDEFGPLSFQ